jgi:hypothetical protein
VDFEILRTGPNPANEFRAARLDAAT